MTDPVITDAPRRESKIAWLIERADPRNPACVLSESFLGLAGAYDGVAGSGYLQWMHRAEDAIRFVRRKDAAMFIGAMEQMQDRLPHRETLQGLRSGDPRAIVTEHAWTMDAQP